METILTSPTQEVRIGPEQPFVIIGERINPTGRKKLAAEMAAGDYERVKSDAIAQVAAGAHMLDVNAGIPMVDEPAIDTAHAAFATFSHDCRYASLRVSNRSAQVA